MMMASVLAASPSRIKRINISTSERCAAFGEIGEGVSGVGGMRFEFSDGDVRSAADVSESLSDAFGIFILLVGNEDFQVGVPRVVGVAVGHEIDAAVASIVDHVDVGGGFALNTDGAELDVGMLDGDVRAFGDGNFFVEGVEGFVGLVADVGHVDTAVLGGDFGEGNEFVGSWNSCRFRIRGRKKGRELADSWPGP